MSDISEQTLIDHVRRRLAHRFAHVSADQISDAVARAHAQFEQSPVRTFVPLMVERRAGEELSRRLWAACG